MPIRHLHEGVNLSCCIIIIDGILMVVGIVLCALDVWFDIEQVKGFWLIFSPFAVCFVWAIRMKLLSDKDNISDASECKKKN